MKKFKKWKKEKRFIPIMIKKYCKGWHKKQRKEQGIRHSDVCKECQELTEYALFRLDKCPFKENKSFCSFCKIHCYKPEMRDKIKEVMRYSGPRMLATHPIFAISHVIQVLKYKKSLKGREKEND